MNAIDAPRIVECERVDGSVVIGFDDGRIALFSSELLYSVLPFAKDITDIKEEQ